MFVGHLAVALGATRLRPRLPLAALAAAAFGLDLLWPVFLLLGLETVRIDPGNTAFTPLDFVSYPWSHSLLMSAVWGAVAGALAARRFGSRTAGLVIAAAVVSHWVLDAITHRPDLPLWPGGGPKLGLSLWNSVPATFIVEGALFVVGIVLYVRRVPARDATGRWAFIALLALVTAIWASGPFSPPPPSVTAIAIVGLAFGLLTIPWLMWIEKHRQRVKD
jgi:hypothetical protein